RVVLEAKGVRKAFGENVVLRHLDLMVERGDRIALVGPNGAGKSTLMRLLAGVDVPDEGQRVLGHRVVLDYFAQDQAAVLNPARTVYEEMSSASPTTMVPLIRNILARFLFSGDDVNAGLAAPVPQPPKPRRDEGEAAATKPVAKAAVPHAKTAPPKAISSRPAVDPRRNGRPTGPGYDPLAPRLRKPDAPPDRQARERD